MRDLHTNNKTDSYVNRFRIASLMNPTKTFQTSAMASNDSISIQDNRGFIQEALQVHNELRQKHGIGPLQLNNDLSKLAQEWGT